MTQGRLKRSLLAGSVLVLPIGVIGIQTARIADYEEDLARARLSQAEYDVATLVRENMIGLLEQIEQMVTATLPADFDPAQDVYYLIPDSGRQGSGARAELFVETAEGLRWLVFPEGAKSVNLRAEEGSARLGDFVRDRDGDSDFSMLVYYQPQARFVPWQIVLDDDENRLRVEYGDLTTVGIPPPAETSTFPEGIFQVAGNEVVDLFDLMQTYPGMNVTDGSWRAYEGLGIWLLTKLPSITGLPSLVLAVDAESLAQQIVDLRFSRTEIELGPEVGLALDDEFANLRVLVPSDFRPDVSEAESAGPSFYEVAIVLAIGFAILGAYFLWRDTRREAELAEMRSQFVSSVSHELKTPLTSIRMFAESLQLAEEAKSDNAETRSDYLEIIVRESERLTRLLNNVLAFSQIERGLRTYYLQAENLGEILHDVAQMLQFPLAEQGFTLDLSIADEVPSIRVDRDAIEQAVLNLLSNAIKFSGDSRQIELTLETDGSDAVVAVIDHGIGIPERERNRIFESFYRVSSNNDLAISGTGLGLAIVKHIADGHGGRVTVDSEPGNGSTFSLRIPIDRRSGG